MSTILSKIALKAKENPTIRFTSLAHLLTPEFLKATWKQMNKGAASGIDGETMEQYGKELNSKVVELVERLKSGNYKAPVIRRVEIPKGNGKTRPLGITTVEDRLVQRAVARILSAIFEQDFLEVSHGYRPGRGPHDALRMLRSQVVAGKVRHVYEADIRGYFTNINHKWLREMIAHRIADRTILRLINRWLKAGVMIDGVVVQPNSGTPQGWPISCIAANVYLHYVLDLWFEKKFKKQCQGEAYLVRFVDDFVCCFEYRKDAELFDRELKQRMGKFGLELAPEKTRMMEFGKFARGDVLRRGKKPETFEFLGFKHVCGTDSNGKFALIRQPSQKRCKRFLDSTKEWLSKHIHWKRRDQQRHLTMMLKGFYQYYSLHHCKRELDNVQSEVVRQWRRCIKRQSQRNHVHWSYLKSREWFKLPYVDKAIHKTV
jgi:RNA-directed DNA polymerase